MKREPQTWAYLRGDLEGRRSLLTDLRNDNAGSEKQQLQNLILRYLEAVPAQDPVSIGEITTSISRHWPFQGAPASVFDSAFGALEDDGWIKRDGDLVILDQITRVTRRYLTDRIRRTHR